MRLSRETEAGIAFGATQALGLAALADALPAVTSPFYSAFVLSIAGAAFALGLVVRNPWKWTLAATILSSCLVASLLFTDAASIAMCWSHAAATFLGVMAGSVLRRAFSARGVGGMGGALLAGMIGVASLVPGFSLSSSGQEYLASAAFSWKGQARLAIDALSGSGETDGFRSWKSTSDLMNDLQDAPLGSKHAVRTTWTSYEAFKEEMAKASECVALGGERGACFKQVYDASPEVRRPVHEDALDATFGALLEFVFGQRIRERRIS